MLKAYTAFRRIIFSSTGLARKVTRNDMGKKSIKFLDKKYKVFTRMHIGTESPFEIIFGTCEDF